ncbi:hypothetical protein BDE36_0416 [Arcticibacter tournemirensis]|uniref:Uncharacterized protein n=1 Tax=Arcticibacter tournemirensis TaxID=699437 RepID=A0A5M9HGE6_9SPHI|nr:hypothetical protein [Arcticibacter tournemirensis]KAA8485559.1 hypothetical protein F1649_03500 [Arcticibacter tournemirensis]TQM48726.1 hypothetical protein BDE36_0416 [Arcticibacter tournemirensis]
MENHEENNIQQEIIDSLAKKMTDLEKRQSKIDELNLTALPSKIEDLETKIGETAEMKTLENSKQLERFGGQLNRFDAKLDAIPKAIPIKHEFEPKSRLVIKTVLGLILCICVLLAIGINLYLENNKRSDATNKYLLLRGFYPDITRQIDSAYNNNPDSLIKKAQSKIDERETVSQAAIEAKQAAEESKAANDKLRKLRGKFTTTSKHKK